MIEIVVVAILFIIGCASVRIMDLVIKSIGRSTYSLYVVGKSHLHRSWGLTIQKGR